MNPIFVSGTFRDLNEIRSFITHDVGSELNKWVHERYGETYTFTDLRIGAENLRDDWQTVTTCLKRLKDAAVPNPFIVILGDRYGWSPNAQTIQEAIDHLGKESEQNLRATLTEGEKGRSITELEIAYGAFGLGQKTPDAYKKRTVFLFAAEGNEDNARLRKLKKTIAREFPKERVFRLADYGAEPLNNSAFKRALLAQLQTIVNDAYGNRVPTEEQREQKIHANFRDQKAAGFYGRERLVENVTRTLFSGDCDITYIHGPTGAGKSSLVSKIVKDADSQAFTLYCGLTKNSDSALEIIRMISARLESALDDLACPYTDPVDRYRALCRAYDDNENTPPLLIAIDAVDQLRPDDYAQKLAFLPLDKNGYKKLHFLVSGTYDGSTVEGRWRGFVETGTQFRSIQVGSIRREDCAELCQSIFSQELGIGDVADEVTQYLKKKPFDTPLHLKITLLRLALFSDRDIQLTQAAGSDAQKRAEAFIRILRSFIVTDRQFVPMDTLSIKLLRLACEQIDPRLFSTLQYIALSRHGLPLTVIERLYGNGFDETRFWRLYYRLENIFFEHSDGCIDFTHKCFRNALRKELGQSRYKAFHRHILEALKAAKSYPDLQDSEIPYHAVEADKLRRLYAYITANFPKAKDSPKTRERKARCLRAAANTLREVSPYDLFSYDNNEHITIAFSRFCITTLFEAYSCSLTDTRNCLTMLSQLIDAYVNVEEYNRISYYPDASPDFIEHYHHEPPVATTLKAFSASCSPLLYFYEALQAVERYLIFAHQQREQFHFFEEYEWNDRDKVTVLQRFLDCAGAYTHFDSPYGRYRLFRELNEPRENKIDRLQAFFHSRLGGYDRRYFPWHTKAPSDDTDDEEARRIRHIINQGQQALDRMAKLTIEDEEEPTTLSAQEIARNIRELRTKVKTRDGNHAPELVAFLCKNLRRYSELEKDKTSTLKLCRESLEFLKQYMAFYGFHLGAFDTIRECLKIIESCYVHDNPNKTNKVNALYHELVDFFIRFYSSPSRLGTNELNTAEKVQQFFEDFQKRLQDPAVYQDKNEQIRGYKKLCLFLETRLSVTHIAAISSDHVHAFRDMATTFNDTVRFFVENQPQAKNARNLIYSFLKAVDAYIRRFETKKLVGTEKNLVRWLADETHFPYLANNDIYPLLKENLLSLLDYEKGFRFLVYTNEEGKYVRDTWDWKPKNRGVIK